MLITYSSQETINFVKSKSCKNRILILEVKMLLEKKRIKNESAGLAFRKESKQF